MLKAPKKIQINFTLAFAGGNFDWDISAVRYFVGNSFAHGTNGGGRQMYIETREGFGGVKWIALMESWVLGKDGKYHYEPMPSSRTDEFIANTRFDTKEQALAALLEYERLYVTQVSPQLTVPIDR